MSGGNLNHPPMSMTYASVVSRDSVHLAFLILTLNYLDILSCDIQDVYLNTLSKDEVFFTLVMNGSLSKENFLLLLELFMA